MNVLGIDPSLTNTGFAWTGADGSLQTMGAKTDPNILDFSWRISSIIEFLRHRLSEQPKLVVMEGCLNQARGHAVNTVRLHGVLEWVITQHHGAPPVLVPPSTLKKWSTGKGTATKGDMVKAARGHGYEGRSHDEADAVLLRAYGFHWLELEADE